MSSWGNNDNAANTPLWAAMSVNLTPDSANQTSLFDNTTANNVAVTLADGSVRNGEKTVGVFGVDANEADVTRQGAHTGWVLRTVGQGGRAGRVLQEVLVAMNTILGDADGQVYANVAISLTQPTNQSVYPSVGYSNAATFTVGTSLTGNTAANITYQWQVNSGGSWTNVANNTPANTEYVGGTTGALEVLPADTTANAYVYRVIVSAADEGVSVTSANAVLTVL